MDPRRFDALARAATLGASRRRFIHGLAALSAGGFAARAATAQADSTDDGVGGSDGLCSGITGTCAGDADCAEGQVCTGGICRPRPAGAVAAQASDEPRPARIIGGTCAALDSITAFPLFEVGRDLADSAGDAEGTESAIPARTSATTIRTSLGALLEGPHAIVVDAGADDATAIACGDIGGRRVGNDLAVGLQERNGSGVSGIAWLRGDDGNTLVYLFLAQGLGGGVGAAVASGTTLVTTDDDVNLRAEPTTDAQVVAMLAKGTEVTVTGVEQSGWLPVENPESGESGYIAAQFLASVE